MLGCVVSLPLRQQAWVSDCCSSSTAALHNYGILAQAPAQNCRAFDSFPRCPGNEIDDRMRVLESVR
jgi:hypothetical protein